MRLYNRF